MSDVQAVAERNSTEERPNVSVCDMEAKQADASENSKEKTNANKLRITASVKRRERQVELVLGFPDESMITFERESFPSKIGGRPTPLLSHPPPVPRCSTCHEPLRFLLQVYAPVGEYARAFHRMLYLYICVTASCVQLSGSCSVCVLRAQLPRRNELYPYDAGGEAQRRSGDAQKSGHGHVGVCSLCGGRASERCSGCTGDMYCSRMCQRSDWRLGHKRICLLRRNGALDEESDEAMQRAICELNERRREHLFREIGLETEVWSDEDGSCSEDGEESEAEAEVVKVEQTGSIQDASAEELPEDLFQAQDGGRGPTFERFCRVTKDPPDQVVRYARGGICLWMHEAGQYEGASAMCTHCSSPMEFELEVLPRLVYYVEAQKARQSIDEVAQRLRDGLDWGVIAVFSCRQSCEIGHTYVRELAWLQCAAS